MENVRDSEAIYNEIEAIICELLLNAYNNSKVSASEEIESRIIDSENLSGISKSETMSMLLKEKQTEIISGKDKLIEAIRKYKLSIFKVFEDTKEVKQFIDYLSPIVAQDIFTDNYRYFINYDNAVIIRDNRKGFKTKEEIIKLINDFHFYNYFLQIFKSYRIVEILHAQQPKQNTINTENQQNNKIKDEVKLIPKNKEFKEFLLSNAPPELMKILHELLDYNTSGKFVATVLEALQDKKYLCKHLRIVPKVKVEFKLNCSATSINNYFEKKIITIEERQPIIEKLP